MLNNSTTWRLSKYLSLFANISRREAEREINIGNVMLNNALPKNAAISVTKKDIITYKKRRIVPSRSTIEKINNIECYAIYKPIGTIVTRNDEKNRKTVYDALPNEMQNFHYIGRLDYNSEGLLLFTNNSQFARNLENPKNNIPRTYHVKTYGLIDAKRSNVCKWALLLKEKAINHIASKYFHVQKKSHLIYGLKLY